MSKEQRHNEDPVETKSPQSPDDRRAKSMVSQPPALLGRDFAWGCRPARQAVGIKAVCDRLPWRWELAWVRCSAQVLGLLAEPLYGLLRAIDEQRVVGQLQEPNLRNTTLVGEQESLAAAQPGTEVGDSLAELWRSGYVCAHLRHRSPISRSHRCQFGATPICLSDSRE